MPLTHRERILAAIHHRPVDRVPTDIWATPEIMDKLYVHFGVNTRLGLCERLDIDGIFGIGPRYIGPPAKRDGDYYENAWGMGFRPQAYGTGVYDEQAHYPLAQAETIADLRAYRWPSPDWHDYAALPERIEGLPNRAIECGYSAPFYYHNQLRGLELSLMDPLVRPEFTHYLLDRLSEYFTEYHRRCFEAAPGRIDLTQVTDDFGWQGGLLISPKVFDEFYREPLQRAIDLAHSFGIAVFHHDDGDMRGLLPRLVDMGIQVLNPIQWRAGNWDLAALKADYGDRLCFHGGVDNQQTLCFGTPEDVRAEVSWLVENLGSDRTGLIIASCHDLQPITPIENILAMYDAAREYGTFAQPTA